MTTEQWPSQQPPAEQPQTWSYATEPVPVEEGRRRRRVPLLVAVATVVTVVLGAAAYAGVRLWYGSGAQPEDATPAGVAAFARLDLSPGYGQRLKIDSLMKKFPQKDGKKAVDELEAGIFDALDIEKETYRKHVEPWFGKRIGAALWLDAAKRPYGLIVLNSNDDDAARAGLGEVRRGERDEFGFVVRDGHVLLAYGDKDTQAAAEAAAAEAARTSLADSTAFARAVDWLPSQQTGLAWADFDRLAGLADVFEAMDAGRLWTSLFGPSSASALMPGMVTGGVGGESEPKGQVIVGASATDNGLELRFRAFGTGATVPADDVRSTVDALPADSALAASVRLGDLDHLKDALPTEEMDGTDPFSALSGARLTVAAALAGDMAFAASADTTSARNAQDLAQALKLFTGGADEVTVTTQGDRVELKSKGYATGGGKLSGQALYREAMAGAPDRAYAVLYVDVQRMLAEESESERRDFAAVKAVGLVVGAQDGDPVGLVRVVIR